MVPFITKVITKFGSNKARLMDILIDIQTEFGYIPQKAIEIVAENLDMSESDVNQTASFYHFFSSEPTGEFRIYLNDSVVSNMMGRMGVKAVFENQAGCKFGEVTDDGKIGLFDTADIGMNDQEPAALINNVVFTNLNTEKAKAIIDGIKAGKNIDELNTSINGKRFVTAQIKSNVKSNIMQKGPILEYHIPGTALRKAVAFSAPAIIAEIKESGLRGRGGAGFPTGLKWDFCAKTEEKERYIFCNADEGEPGTFKDRVILTNKPSFIFEGMALAAYAVKATQGILYLRYEYKYLEEFLEGVLKNMRAQNLLGVNIAGKPGFNFDIRIQFGGGAYVCGEESALIESAEGKRGEPRDRPPFPVVSGYLQKPTVVNNVETLCACTKVIEKGAEWFKTLGTFETTGTKILSISGDCAKPGIYEVEWGFSVKDLLKMVEAENVQAVQVGGPSGNCIEETQFDRKLCYSDLATGGAIIIIGKQRDLLKDVVHNYLEFFIEESCGSCVPCRAMTVQYKNKLEKILRGNGVQKDLDEMKSWESVMRLNRCGLGQTAANPVITTLENFPELYKNLIKEDEFVSEFNLANAVKESCKKVGRNPILAGGHNE